MSDEKIRLTGQEVYEIVTRQKEAPGIHLDYDDLKAAYKYAMQAMDKADNTTVYPLIEITDQMQRESYLASLRVELPGNEWLDLSDMQRAMILEIANSKDGRIDDSSGYIDSSIYRPLYKAGYVNFAEMGARGGIAFLTYRGAMIIPRHLVKTKE
jgi:hypothetical protein